MENLDKSIWLCNISLSHYCEVELCFLFLGIPCAIVTICCAPPYVVEPIFGCEQGFPCLRPCLVLPWYDLASDVLHAGAPHWWGLAPDAPLHVVVLCGMLRCMVHDTILCMCMLCHQSSPVHSCDVCNFWSHLASLMGAIWFVVSCHWSQGVTDCLYMLKFAMIYWTLFESWTASFTEKEQISS